MPLSPGAMVPEPLRAVVGLYSAPLRSAAPLGCGGGCAHAVGL